VKKLGLPLFAFSLALFAQPARAVTLVHTNDVLGELEPCGCRENPLGGMARMYNLLERTADKDLVLLDAGDLLFPTDVVPPMLAEQSKLQAGFLLKSMNLLHYDAIVPGEKDFALGQKIFDQLRSKAKAHFIAANLVKAGGGAYLEKDIVLGRHDEHEKPVRIGVFGLVGQNIAWPKGLKATSPIAAAKAEVRALKAKKVDFIVALTHETIEEDTKLAESVPGIDLIVGGHSQTFLEAPRAVGSAHIVESSFRNQYVGMLPLTKPMAFDNYKLVGLDAGYSSTDDKQTPMDKLVAEFKQGVADLNTKTDAAVYTPIGTQGSAQRFDTFPRCAECHLKQFDFWRKTRHALALEPLVKANQAFNKECESCHTVGLGKPQGFDNLKAMGSMKDPVGESKAIQLLELEMIHPFLKSIHDAASLSTPIDVPAGPGRAQPSPMPVKEALKSMGPFWSPVQCENCHGPGGDHPLSSDPMPKVAQTTCLQCHTSERAPEWYKDGKPNQDLIEAKFKSIACPMGTAAEPESSAKE
jgi:hypothetical protein